VTAQQLGFAGMPTRLFACTPTRLTTWLDCPRRYRFAYLDRPTPTKEPPWAHNSVGAGVHTALADWYRLVPGERSVATKTDVLALSGRVDRLDLRTVDGVEQLVVVDYKTGRHVLTSSDARSSLALALYALAAARVLRKPCVRVELHHLPSGEVAGHDHTAETLQRHLARAESIAAEAAAAGAAYRAGLDGEAVDRVFPATVSSSCRWCDFSRHCPEGRSAFPPAASWAALAEPD
jgi:RecB family exonuclease